MSNELRHYGVKGMRWGVRRARRQNEKVDKSFKKWNENARKRENATNLGKQANLARMDYERDSKNKVLKKTYKQANKEYKKALNSNTTYRKGAIRGEVGQDMARKYLSESKQIKKKLDKDPTNKELQKQYKYLSDQHQYERAKARKAPEVGAKRSARKAAMKRTMTMTVKTAATAAAITVGTAAVNTALDKHDVTLNGKKVRLGDHTLNSLGEAVKKGKNFMKYFYQLQRGGGVMHDNNELQHYGVIGMKWGVRRARKLDKKIAKARSKGKSEDKIAKKEAKLDKVNKKVNRGAKFTHAVLESVALDCAVSAVSSALIKSGHEEAAKALSIIGGAVSFGNIAGGAVSSIKNRNKD